MLNNITERNTGFQEIEDMLKTVVDFYKRKGFSFEEIDYEISSFVQQYIRDNYDNDY